MIINAEEIKYEKQQYRVKQTGLWGDHPEEQEIGTLFDSESFGEVKST